MQPKLRKLFQNEKGFSLVELLVSMVLLSIIVGALLSAFVSTTKTNIKSAEVVDEGYVAQKWMEEVYNLSKTKEMSEINSYLIDTTNPNLGFTVNYNSSTRTRRFAKQDEGYYVEILVIDSINTTVNNELCNIIVSIYRDSAYTDLLTSMQNVYIIDTPVLS